MADVESAVDGAKSPGAVNKSDGLNLVELAGQSRPGLHIRLPDQPVEVKSNYPSAGALDGRVNLGNSGLNDLEHYGQYHPKPTGSVDLGGTVDLNGVVHVNRPALPDLRESDLPHGLSDIHIGSNNRNIGNVDLGHIGTDYSHFDLKNVLKSNPSVLDGIAAGPRPSIDLAHLPPIAQPTPDAALNRNRNFALPDLPPPRTRQLTDIYEHGIIKLFQQPDGNRLFGLRVSSDHSIRTAVPEYRGAGRHGVALEFRLKF